MSRLARVSIVTLSVVIFLYVGLGYLLGKSSDDKSYRSLSVYGEVLQHIQEDYVDEPNMTLVTAGALHGLLESLDPQSGYLSAREYADYRDRIKNAQHGDAGMTISNGTDTLSSYRLYPTARPRRPACAMDKFSRPLRDLARATCRWDRRRCSCRVRRARP